MLIEKGFDAFAKSIDSDQTAQCAQADLSRYFFILISFLHVKGPVVLVPNDSVAF